MHKHTAEALDAQKKTRERDESSRTDCQLGVGLAAGFVFAATARAVRLVDENVVVASRTDDAVDGFVKLFVACEGSVLSTALFAGNSHGLVAAAGTTAAASAARRRRTATRSFCAVCRCRENGELNCVLATIAFRAGHFGFLVKDDALVVLAAIVADVFVDWHKYLTSGSN